MARTSSSAATARLISLVQAADPCADRGAGFTAATNTTITDSGNIIIPRAHRRSDRGERGSFSMGPAQAPDPTQTRRPLRWTPGPPIAGVAESAIYSGPPNLQNFLEKSDVDRRGLRFTASPAGLHITSDPPVEHIGPEGQLR
jgi:hypothetical protein